MPKEDEWIKFFDPNQTLSQLGVNCDVIDVADFGCGYGTFTIPAAKIITGKIYAFDLEPEMIKTVEQKAKELNLGNVKTILRDFISDGSGLDYASVDYVFLFNILHFEKPELVLFTGTMTPQRPEDRQWRLDLDLNNAEDGLNLLGLFLRKNLPSNPTIMVLF
jgi:SAM-dependent methyltransferase